MQDREVTLASAKTQAKESNGVCRQLQKEKKRNEKTRERSLAHLPSDKAAAEAEYPLRVRYL